MALPLPLHACALAALAQRFSAEDDGSAEARELLKARRALGPGDSWVEAARICMESPAPMDKALVHLGRELGLSLLELLTVALAAAVEEEPHLSRALAWLQAPAGGPRPSLGLVATAFAEANPTGTPPLQALLGGAALRSGLLTRLGQEAPLAEQSLAIPLPFYLALRGHDAPWPGTTLGLNPTSEVPLPDSLREEALRHAHTLTHLPRAALLLRGGSPAEARSLAATVATALGRRPLFLESDVLESLGPYLRLRGLLPVFRMELGPGERKPLPHLPWYEGPVLVLAGPEGQFEHGDGNLLTWALPVPTQQERQQLWQLALGNGALAEQLASVHRHRSGRIAHLGRLARHHAAMRGRSVPEAEDIRAAAWSAEGGGLGSLAQPLPESIGDEVLVAGTTLLAELQALLLRCQAREGLTKELGAAAVARYRMGITALFVGPSGTGKTLAAGWLATRLGMPLYRVDLASVTSKYIGDTEKNLAQLFARAEQTEVVLLFDEADSLFGRRTEVRDSHDRFANAQTNYLLQRLESFDGIALLTSNSKGRMDSAFLRRLDAVVEFPMPGPEERRALWQAHLGLGHQVSPREINRLATLADLCGGHIRNAVLFAAVRARHLGRPVDASDLMQGTAAEYRKLGRHLPSELRDTP
jgi:hypothetical protein